MIENIKKAIKDNPKRWLVTGAAGFIGSALCEELLTLGQHVVGLDNFLTGHRKNIETVRHNSKENADHFSFIEGDITIKADCESACNGADIVLHQAALGSVPRSIKDPQSSHAANVDGF